MAVWIRLSNWLSLPPIPAPTWSSFSTSSLTAWYTRERLSGVHDIYSRYALDKDQMCKIATACEDKGTPFVCTVFSEEGAQAMKEAGVAAFKIASCDMTYHPLLKSVAKLGLPVILSTGLAGHQRGARQRTGT